MSYTQVTLSQFRTDLLAAVETVPYWSTAEANTAINEAIRVWNLLTQQWKTRVIVSSVASQHWYTLPSACLVPFRVIWVSDPLYPSSVSDLDNSKPGWEGQAAGSAGVPTRPMLWAPKGINRICLWPAPSTSSVNFAVDCIQSMPTLSADGDYIDLGREEQGAIILYALHRLAYKEGGPRFQASGSYLKLFLTLAGERNNRLRATTFYKRVVGGPDFDRDVRRLVVPPVPKQNPQEAR